MANVLTVILAAGEGTRMKSALPKVLHKIAHLSMVGHVMKAAGQGKLAVIVAPNRPQVSAEIARLAPHAYIFPQHERLGTAHALLHAQSLFQGEDILMLFGDVPLITPQTIEKLKAALQECAVAVLGFQAQNPFGYGRLVIENGHLTKIVEQKDATPQEQAINAVNGGAMAFKGATALQILQQIKPNALTQEFYVTDAVAIARAQGLTAKAVIVREEEMMGVNDRLQLSQAESVFQRHKRLEMLAAGVTLHAPETVFFAHDTRIEQDVVIEPHVVFGAGVVVKSGAVIHAFSHLEGAIVGENATLGPYARLRPGTVLGMGAKIGNFVETKNAQIHAGAKVNHLSYIGDAEVGEKANIGAGTITCNYDGFNKYKTIIGAGAFIGSNSALVAPVTVKAGAYVGSGSVITDDIDENALGIARGRQKNIAGWAESFRASKKK
jgi:bifunctional UDP-N-acetylglucosamine pyrophosphorylase / glucosamine-1-phosphate N-acetyltransferase